MITIWIVIVNWNGKDNTTECLFSLRKLSHRSFNIQTVVVDNFSNDGSQSAIKNNFSEVHLIESKKNLGFSGGNNVGISYALHEGAHYIWLLNNDTVVDASSLENLLPAMSDKKVGIVGPKIYFYPGREFHGGRYTRKQRGHVIWYAGGLIDWNNVYASHKGVDEVDIGQFDATVNTDFVSGCAMLINAEVFKTVGLLDDKYFLYLEDLDFCIKAKLKQFKLLYVGKSYIWHKNAGSTSRPGNDLHDYYITRNRILFGMRYAPIRSKFALLRQGLLYVLKGKEVKRRAVIDAFTGKYGEGYIWSK